MSPVLGIVWDIVYTGNLVEVLNKINLKKMSTDSKGSRKFKIYRYLLWEFFLFLPCGKKSSLNQPWGEEDNSHFSQWSHPSKNSMQFYASANNLPPPFPPG